MHCHICNAHAIYIYSYIIIVMKIYLKIAIARCLLALSLYTFFVFNKTGKKHRYVISLYLHNFCFCMEVIFFNNYMMFTGSNFAYILSVVCS